MLFQVHGIDEMNFTLFEGHDQRVRARSVAEKADASKHPAASDAGTGENDALSGRQVRGVVNALWILDAHLGHTFVMLGLCGHQTSQDLTVQTAQGCGSEHAFGSAADAHHSVHVCPANRSSDSGGEVAVSDELNARAGGSNIVDQLFVAGP